VFIPIADYMATIGDKKLFDQVCEWMQPYNLGPDPQMYALLVDKLAVVGEFEQAFIAVKEMRARGLKPPGLLYASLLRHLLDAKNWSDGKNVVKEMKDEGEDESIVSICERIIESGQKGNSEELTKMLTMLQSKK